MAGIECHKAIFSGAQIIGEIKERIDRVSVLSDFIMQVRTGGSSSAPHITYKLTTLYFLTLFNQNVLKVSINTSKSKAMVNDHLVTITITIVFSSNHFPVAGSMNVQTIGTSQINTMVVGTPMGKRIVPETIAGSQPAGISRRNGFNGRPASHKKLGVNRFPVNIFQAVRLDLHFVRKLLHALFH